MNQLLKGHKEKIESTKIHVHHPFIMIGISFHCLNSINIFIKIAFRSSPAKDLLKNVHAAWDDIKFIDGYPGEYCCIARKKDEEWFVAAINTEKGRQVEISFHFLSKGKYSATLYSDDGSDSINITELEITNKTTKTFDLLSNGGFVLYINIEIFN